ncbi:MAG TPA: M23 family metallopeptidase [Flavobacterium sp.]|nr:M23 family metallopeptidase [Flavobacterium sp.]
MAKKKKSLKKHLFNKNRIVLLNESTFEETFSLRLNLMNVFVIITLVSIFMLTLTTYIIAFTSLREYIPGYSSPKLNQQVVDLTLKSDSLQNALNYNQAYINSIRQVLLGEVKAEVVNKDSIIAAEIAKISEKDFIPSRADSLLREQVATEDKYNLFEKAEQKVSLVLFAPAKGHITNGFNPKEKHYAVDVALPMGTPVKSVANGTVLFSDWTPDNGNVIIISHPEAMMSVYKHCETITKSEGDIVKTGEVIATAGNSGKHSTGVHLHFELWKNGRPIDPTNFIDFE